MWTTSSYMRSWVSSFQVDKWMSCMLVFHWPLPSCNAIWSEPNFLTSLLLELVRITANFQILLGEFWITKAWRRSSKFIPHPPQKKRNNTFLQLFDVFSLLGQNCQQMIFLIISCDGTREGLMGLIAFWLDVQGYCLMEKMMNEVGTESISLIIINVEKHLQIYRLDNGLLKSSSIQFSHF